MPQSTKFNSWFKPVQRISGEPTVYLAILALVSIIMQNIVLTADRVEFLRRRVRSFALDEILTSTCHQVVLASNQILLAISLLIFLVDGTSQLK